MKIWKIEHTNKGIEGVKIAIAISSNESKGIILKPGEFVLSQEQLTASLDSQTRRGYIKYELFDNSFFNFNLGEVYNTSIISQSSQPVVETISEIELETPLSSIDKLQEAEKDASEYINNTKPE